MRTRTLSSLLIGLSLATVILSGCAGEDYTPDYFPPTEDENQQPHSDASTADRQCTLSFTSQLCVTIKGDKMEVGTGDSEPLCTEVGAFPLHVSGSTVTLKGSEFPDINVEGHGLPAPITINARGDGDGNSNVGEGTIDASGNITIKGFSLYIVALGVVGQVPGLTLTTGSTEELADLPALTGSPPDASGAMTLVTGTVLGHVIDAADEYLMGASLTGQFKGSITPPLSQCGGETERTIEVKKVVIAKDGTQTASPLPEADLMEISQGTYIAESDRDVGGRYEAVATFRVQNIGTRAQQLSIPPRKGPFLLGSTTPLTGQLAPQQSLILTVTFRPTSQDSKPGAITEGITIGADSFQLKAVALAKDGAGSVSAVDDSGNVTAPGVGDVSVGEAAVQANAERRFFLCQQITCNGAPALTKCGACQDPSTQPCELLAVSTEGRPMAEVDAQCKPLDPDATPMITIDLKGSGNVALSAHKQVLALRNTGVRDLTISAIALKELPESQSRGQFSLPKDAIFIAKKFSDIQAEVAKALQDQQAQGTKLPAILPPFQPGYQETTAYIVITYTPTDLLGADGQQAGVGSSATDKAVLTITTDSGEITTEVSGTTTITESPALELYLKTSTGTKQVTEGNAFPFKGITGETLDLAIPLFLRVADTTSATLRITGITLGGTDAARFKWLDTKEKIAAVSPPAGKGMRCSIPIVDEKSGTMTGESFDLNPVSVAPPGYDMAPGAFSTATMPLFGCIDFHREASEKPDKRLYEATLGVDAVELTAQGMPAQNPDGSARKTTLTIRLLAALNPRSGQFVLRITQTMAAILNPQFPGLSAVSARADMTSDLASGKALQTDLQVFTGSMTLDPFDEMTITTLDGKKTLTTPNDGVTGVFRAVDTHPVSKAYGVEGLFDYASLIHDDTLGEGMHGVYDDYAAVPEGARANGWRIFTTMLSYPGPLGPEEKKPPNPSNCRIVNPCDPEGLKAFTDAGAAGGKGACAFFYASGGRFDSPAFHTKEEMEGGAFTNLCNRVDQPQELYDIDTGRVSVDGNLVFEEVGLRFFGPTFFHNPGGPLGSKPAMDTVFHMAFTTGVLAPQQQPTDPDVLPDKRIDLTKSEFKMNLTDKSGGNPPICANNTANRVIDGKTYSTWHYLDGLLFKDEAGTIPAGCPEKDNDFNGGQAYLRGMPIDPETGNVTFITGGRFGSSDDLTFAFKDVMMFIVLKGWFCDPAGSEENFEGPRCFDLMLNDRDAESQLKLVP